MNTPLVTVICVCYNHARFVTEALDSVKAQTYQPIELIVIDDGSTDGSPKIIKQWIASHPETVLLLNGANIGYCKTFNKALKLAKGKFIMDLAADDVMVDSKIADQINLFDALGDDYGVVFSDAEYIDEFGKPIREHFQHLFIKGLIGAVPQGDIYRDVLDKYFIPAPSMLSRIEVYQMLKGYDEELAYEDFDFWVRSSRNFKYGFIYKKLVKIRRTSASMSTGWYKPGDPQLFSTYKVCIKAMNLNRNTKDWQAWKTRVRYELRQTVFSQNFHEAGLFYSLLAECNQAGFLDWALAMLNKLRLPLSPLRRTYHRLRFR